MEAEVGGDKLKEATIPGRGKKRPASSPSDDGEDLSMSTSDSNDDCWEFSEEEQEEEEENDDEDYRDTATSRAKKSKSPMVKLLKKRMRKRLQTDTEEAHKIFLNQRKSSKARQEKQEKQEISRCQRFVVECGATEDTEEYFMTTKLFEKAFKRFMANNVRIQEERNKILAAAVEAKIKAKQQQEDAICEKIKQVQRLAKECGVQESDPINWLAVLRICQDPVARDLFIATDTQEGRRAVIDSYAKGGNSVRQQPICDANNDDSSDDEFDDIFRIIAEDDNNEFLSGMLMYAMHHDWASMGTK